METQSRTVRGAQSYGMLKRDIEMQLTEQRAATQALERPFVTRMLIGRIEQQLDEQRPIERRGAQSK